MIENYFTKFNTSSEYNTYKESSGYTVPNVSWVVKENKIESEPYVYHLTSGIVVHKNGEFREVSYNDFDAHYEDIVLSGYTIEGVIAVPSTHTPDSTTRIMSLKLMSTGSPDVGVTTSGNTMYWGGYHTDLSGLTNYATFATISNQPGETTVGTHSDVNLPSDYSGFTGAQSVVDSKAKYHTYASSDYAPSPYADGGEPNSLYSITTVTNGLSDMDGSGNTEIIVANATAQTNWRTASTITNNSGVGYYPAACCCKRYGTSGIPSGSWYLPSIGEFGYVIARLGTINSIFALINTKDSSLGMASIPATGFWSSSEYGSANACYVGTSNGRVNWTNKNTNFHVLAFASVHSTPLVF